jgi:hypothetical protein
MGTLVLAEFETPQAMLAAARALRAQGVSRLDSYTPYPVHGLEDALGLRPSNVPKLAAAGALTGLSIAYGTQFYLNTVNYPIDVGGRPIHSAPMFIPVTFELAVLLTAFAIFFGMLILWRLPRPHHPVFELESFRSASTHAFWLSAEVLPDQAEDARERMRALGAQLTSTVEGSL